MRRRDWFRGSRNHGTECRATLEGLFKSIAILDEESLLSVRAYIDLNLVAAGIAPTREANEHTPLKARAVKRN